MNDLIWKHDIMDIIKKKFPHNYSDDDDSNQYDEGYGDALNDVGIAVSYLPSAESEVNDEWRKRHYQSAYNQGFIDGCKSYERTHFTKLETISDSISRQMAIDALKEHRALYCDNTPNTFSKLSYTEKSRVDELDTAIAILVNLPSTESERKTGKWIKKKNIMLGDYIECSLCKNVESRIAPGWWNGKKYCPNCGAKMKGNNDEID